MPIFTICAEKNIPVTTHCGGNIIATTSTSVKYEGLKMSGNTTVPTDGLLEVSYKDRAIFFNNPANWEPVLFHNENLKLNLGHFGGLDQWEDLAKGNKDIWLTDIFRLMAKYKYLYADHAYNIYKNNLGDIVKAQAQTVKEVKERSMFGSDYPVVLTAANLNILSDMKRFRTKLGTELWKAFQFDKTPQTNDTSRFDHCNIMYGKAPYSSGTESKGGAFYFDNYSRVIISNSFISNNSAANFGGAIYCTEGSSPEITNNTLNNNSATKGAAIYCYDNCDPEISGNTISNNSATDGGGICCNLASPTISGNTISNNSGGGIYCEQSSSTITGNTSLIIPTLNLQGGFIAKVVTLKSLTIQFPIMLYPIMRQPLVEVEYIVWTVTR